MGAGFAGGGIGTVIAAIADGISPNSAWKTVLTVSSPLIAIGIGGLWLFLKTVYIDPFAIRKKHEAENTRMERIINDAKKLLADRDESEQSKQETRKELETLKGIRLRKMRERMQVFIADSN